MTHRRARADGKAGGLDNGGLQQMFAMVLAGLAAKTPRMVSASVIALARLTFEFASELRAIAAQLLPVVCALLRTKAREIVKAVLGFLKVAAMRIPADMLTPHISDILTGVLLWAEDTKNRFKLKVRQMLKRLMKRCGYDAVAAAWPPSQAKLLTALRKDMGRTARRKAGASSAGGSAAETQPDGETGSMARTARASEWRHSAIFSDGGTAATAAAKSAGGKSKGRTGQTGVHIPLHAVRRASLARFHLKCWVCLVSRGTCPRTAKAASVAAKVEEV